MKSHEVLSFLNITRPTLTKYVKNGTIKVTKLDNGYYDYDSKSVFSFAKKDIRLNYIYCRVSTYKQKNDLTNQIQLVTNYCIKNNIKVDNTFSEISGGIDFDRKQFSLLLNDVLSYKVSSVFISNKDRLTRFSFKTLENIFNKFGTEIVVVNDNDNINESDEMLEELFNLMHIFSTKMYSNRKNNIKKY
jgi:predicted site-specific integrase-resolvase